MTEIPNVKPNSNRYREKEKSKDEHRVSKVTKGAVKKKEATTLQKFAKSFLPEDAKSMKDYVAEETPGLIKWILRKLAMHFLDIYFPESGQYYRGPDGRRSSTTAFRYDTIRGGNSSVLGVRERNTNQVYEYQNIYFDEYGDAEDVLDGLYDCIQRYERASVFDMYDLSGVSANATDRNYGWTDLRGTKIVATRDGYTLTLPRALPLN